jgi:four helix bundle protein
MKTYDDWAGTIPAAISLDPLWKMKVYRLALFLNDLTWHDVTKLAGDSRTISLADQLYRAVSSIGANIAEGYSRRSGKDRTRFYEYALGSARESRHWYFAARQLLPEQVITHRLELLAEIARLLIFIIPQERNRNLAETPAAYTIVQLDDS